MKPSNGIIEAWNEHIIKEYLYNKASPSVSALNSLSEIITPKPNIVYQNLLDMSNNEEYVEFLAKAQKPLTPKSTPKPLEETKEDIKKKLRKIAENPYNLFSNIPNAPSELLFNDFLDMYKYENPNANISSSEYSSEIATYILTKFINCQHTLFTLSPISFDFHYPSAEATDLKEILFEDKRELSDIDIYQFVENPNIIQNSEYSTRKNYSSTAYYEVTKDFNVNIVKFLLNEYLSAFGLGVSVNETNLLQIIKI